MKRLVAWGMVLALSCCLRAQQVDTTVCDVLKDPAAFNAKTVRIQGVAQAGFDSFVLKDKPCGLPISAIWLDYPEGTHGKAGPLALLQLQPARNYAGSPLPAPAPAAKLDKSKDFKTFDSLLSTPHKIAGMCLGCNRYQVTATLVGRLDTVPNAGVKRDKAGKITGIDGYGNLNAYPVRLVIQSVAGVAPVEIDYSRSDPIARDDKPQTARFVGVDPDTLSELHGLNSPGVPMYLDSIRQLGDRELKVLDMAAANLPKGSPAQLAIERAAAAIGGKGEYSGVFLGYGPTNEASARNEAPGPKDSPDGVLYNCSFNAGRLDEDSMIRALIHLGQHIADIRTPSPDGPLTNLFALEYQAWATTMMDAVGSRQKTLTLPGGYMLWNEGWPQDRRQSLFEQGLQDYLLRVEMFAR